MSTTTGILDGATVVKGHRKITFRWLHPEIEPWSKGAVRVVDLTVHHSASRKALIATLRVLEVEEVQHSGGHYAVEHHRMQPGYSLTLYDGAVKRYSARALAFVSEEALDLLRDYLKTDDNEQVQALFAGQPFDNR
jgi:hypothetical protein